MLNSFRCSSFAAAAFIAVIGATHTEEHVVENIQGITKYAASKTAQKYIEPRSTVRAKEIAALAMRRSEDEIILSIIMNAVTQELL